MTLRVNPEFAASLSAATTSNIAWSTAFKNGLGTTRRVVCKIAPAGTAQANVYATGTTFRDAAITGDMTIEAGIVTKYGATSDLTTCTAADLSADVAVLRITGNGNWIEGTLGLAGSNADFIVPANPTATNSIAVTPNLRIKPPPFLPSGPGSYPPPSLSTEAPAYVIIEDWRDPSNVVEAGRIHFNNRMENWTFTDEEVAANMGDVRVTGSTESVVFGNPGSAIEFGSVMFSMNGAVNAESSRAVHQVLVYMKPTEDNWPGYPRYSGYRLGTRTFDVTVSYGVSNTFPEAFKAKLCRADGTVIHIWDMPRDHLPINSPELSEIATKSKPLRPKMHCAQMLFWQSNKPKMSTKSKKWFPGMDMRAVRPSMNKEKSCYAGVWPMGSLGFNLHAAQHWFAQGKWANAISVEAFRADPCLDPYLFNINEGSTTDNGYSTPKWASVHGVPESEFATTSYGFSRLRGWGYEPGNCGIHDQTTGDGGVRPDRGFMAGPMMIALTDPTWIHLRDNTPASEMVEHWNMGYFNHAVHYFTNVKTLEMLPVQELLMGDWSFCRSYYGSNNSYTSGGTAFAVPQFATRFGSVGTQNARPHGGMWTDLNYRLPWNGYAIDGMHDYSQPGDVALHWNSPAHAFSAKHRYLSHLMVGLGQGKTRPNTSAHGYFASRVHAWRMKQHATMWKLASENPTFGISRADIEKRILTELNQVYLEFYIPMWVENSQDTRMACLRRFGIPINWSPDSGKWTAETFNIIWYMAGVLMLMRQYGLFKKLWDMGEMPQKALLTIIRLLDAGSIQWFTQTKGSYMNSTLPGAGSVFDGPPYIPIDHTTEINPELPLNWGDWRDRKWPLQGQEDWIHLPDGSFSGLDSSEHLKGQWPSIRLNFFRDVECLYSWTEVQQAADIVAGFHDQWAAKIVKNREVEKVAISSMKGKEWFMPIPYALILKPNPADVEAL